MSFTPDEILRYSRQAALPGWGASAQRRLRGSAAQVAGTGVAARVALRYLAGAGVGRLMTEVEPAMALETNPHVAVEAAPASGTPTARVAAAGRAFVAAEDTVEEGARIAAAALLAIVAANPGDRPDAQEPG